ncbi:transcriptional pleiotropic regulator of transition state genes [Pullulanibacillus pueri]|uniref:Transition state regulatory protein AbrB n=1 Tax=Pullulanibacillus pueri TaxID=1437324 RepID=A0A8J2ZW48_9BACL|nr:AbrB/MazE/SpoVT family DNA-binding domain-containing protein [Pullulanibacillus pueri]MBM7682271.1 transcriptional pleiotropic regulator of transition state genes [Pullulanibacillus pueri]GGH81002.1 transition state regulatory protein AbrB [Pullulanibacillus pueri]
MKSTGITRKVDELGRIVIPIELRRSLSINIKDPMEIFTENDRIILQKYKPGNTCQVTGETSEDNLILGGGKLVLSKEGAEIVMKELESYLQVAPAQE